MNGVVWLEGAGALLCLVGAVLVWRRAEPRFSATRSVLLLLLLSQAGLRIVEALEWSGWPLLSQTGETLAVVVPILWLFVVSRLSGELMLQRIKRRESQLSLILQHAPVGLAVLDLQGRHQLSNARWSALLDADLPEGRALAELSSPLAAEARALVARAHSLGEPQKAAHPIPAAGDGAWARLAVAPWSLARAIDGVVVVAEDISREVADAEQTRQHMEALHHGNRIELLNLLSAATAHDLRNSLTVLTGNVYLLELGGLSPKEQGESVQAMRQAVDMSTALLENLTRLSRTQTGAPQPIALVPFLEENYQLLTHSLSRQVRLRLALCEHDVVIDAVPVHLQQILLNLVVNARDAMPGGGIVTLSLAVAPSAAALAVRDEGVGMAPEIVTRIFEPLFTTKGPEQGTGLGLAIVRSLVDGLGGEIAVESAEGEGTTVTVRLPTAAASAIG